MGFFDIFKKKNKKNLDDATYAATAGANIQNVTRHSAAAQEYLKAYDGYDPNSLTGKPLVKSLSDIAAEKPNMSGQKGYAAERIEVAHRNAEQILKGEKPDWTRVDDAPGHKINETAHDIIRVDSEGNDIAGTGYQMKVHEQSPKEVASKLMSKEYQSKYSDGKFILPSDDPNKNQAIIDELKVKEVEYQRQYDRAVAEGKWDVADQKKSQIEYCKKLQNGIEDSKVTAEEAKYAVTAPKQFTAGEVAKMANDAGLQYAAISAGIQGGLSVVKNIKRLIDGEIDNKTAIKEIAKDTAKAGAIGYVTGAGTTVVGAAFEHSKSEFLHTLAQNNVPAYAVGFGISIFTNIKDCVEGKINAEQCVNGIVKSGVSTVASATVGKAVGAVLGSAFGPIGSMVGSFATSLIVGAVYDETVKTFKNLDLAKKERKEIEAKCKQMQEDLAKFRADFERTYIAYTKELTEVFGNAMKNMAIAIKMGNPDMFIGSTNTVTKALGGKVQYESVDEFQEFLMSDEPFEL